MLAAASAAALGACQKAPAPPLPIGARIAGPYALAAKIFGADSGRLVCYRTFNGGCVERIKAPVVELGWDEDFIAAAVRTGGEPDGVEYFYIVRDFDGPHADRERVVRGPYDEAEFDEERREHGVPGVAPIRLATD